MQTWIVMTHHEQQNSTSRSQPQNFGHEPFVQGSRTFFAGDNHQASRVDKMGERRKSARVSPIRAQT